MSQRPIYVTFAALMALLVATIAISFVPLGTANTALAMAIAVTKLMLVVVVFMNLRGSTGTTRLAAAAGVLWLSIAMVCVLADYHTRGWHEGNERSAQVGETLLHPQPGGQNQAGAGDSFRITQ